MSARHRFENTESLAEGVVVQRCLVCAVERIPCSGTKTLFRWRRGRAILRGGRKMSEDWMDFVSGVIPKCTGEQA